MAPFTDLSQFLPPFLTYYTVEILLAFIFLLFILFIVSFLNQRSRYKRLRQWIKRNTLNIKSQESSMKGIGQRVGKFKQSQEGMEYWSNIKDDLGELSKLPSIQEKENEIILRLHLSKLKKDDTDVTANPKEIKINVYSERIPLRCSYALPNKIKPHKLNITYEGNTLEIRAPKA